MPRGRKPRTIQSVSTVSSGIAGEGATAPSFTPFYRVLQACAKCSDGINPGVEYLAGDTVGVGVDDALFMSLCSIGWAELIEDEAPETEMLEDEPDTDEPVIDDEQPEIEPDTLGVEDEQPSNDPF